MWRSEIDTLVFQIVPRLTDLDFSTTGIEQEDPVECGLWVTISFSFNDCVEAAFQKAALQRNTHTFAVQKVRDGVVFESNHLSFVRFPSNC